MERGKNLCGCVVHMGHACGTLGHNNVPRFMFGGALWKRLFLLGSEFFQDR